HSSRSVPRQLRKALNLRDRHCLSPGCTTPPELCSPHHRRHWADGGPTHLSNLELRCDVHHARLHPENHRFRRSRAP
ncbi:MAG TPA: HNH endonuclease signature motif containing protein, partial [Candidatus Dormibacteraeota bacterium]|nr:HNH endonuclease signature motif containing protein [Candidatus Dormibacteraeota bacterium]